MTVLRLGSSRLGGTSGGVPSITAPVVPLMVIRSPALKVLPPMVITPLALSTKRSPQPATQGLPMPRATTAAWLVMPPRLVRMPWATFMPAMSSGLVSRRTSTTLRPAAATATASSALKTTSPWAAPGEAGRPVPSTFELGLGIDLVVQQLVQVLGLDQQQGLVRVDQALRLHLGGDADGGHAGALAVAGLQHPEAAVLDGELDVLHVLVVGLEALADLVAGPRRPRA